MNDLSGIYPPIPVPFNEDESIHFAHLEANLEHWSQQPLEGVVVPGSNSEAPYLTDEERLEIWKLCGPYLKERGKTLIAGTGVETTSAAIQLTEQAAAYGASAALVIPPIFYKPAMTEEVLLAHYRALADASPIPILVYNVPAFTGIDFSPAILLRMAEHPNIIGMKNSSATVTKIALVLAQRPDFIVFAGTGSAYLPFLSLGAVGVIAALANFAAEPLKRVENAFRAGKLDEARREQLALAQMNLAVTSRYGVPGLKYAMDRSGFFGGPTRRPLLPLKPEGCREIDRLLAEIGLLKPS